MSDKPLTLNCLLFGYEGPIDHVLLVRVARGDVVGDLEELVKIKEPTLSGCNADQLILWKPKNRIFVDESLENELGENPFSGDGFERLLRVRPLDSIFVAPLNADELHVLVQAPTAPSARKHSPESHSGDDDKRKRLKGSPEVAQGLEKGRPTLAELHERILQLSADPADYSDPSSVVELPFPSTNEIPSRFAVSADGSFFFLGRQKFATIWDTWLKISADTRHRQAIYIYGTRGYGKSHILAALACLLVRNGQRVVYLPDCRAMLSQPFTYLRNALLFAFAGSSSSDYRQRIWQCHNVDALEYVCKQYRYEGGKLCFIMDQQNALYQNSEGQGVVADKEKSTIGSLLGRMAFMHVEITSASADDKTVKYMQKRDTGDQKIALMGGMTTAEMSYWWSHHAEEFVAFSDDDKLRVEDLTGCIPLLLDPFLGHSGKSLEALEPEVWDEDVLTSVVETAYDFAAGQKKDPLFKVVYVPLMQACLTHSYVSGSGPMLDHRYFYLEKGCGRYTCGLARQGIIEFLRIHVEEDVFLDSEWYLALTSFKNNPSITGFAVEQMVISRIASKGLCWGNTSIPPAPVAPFHGNVTTLPRDKPSTYYIPLKVNRKAIDALYAEVNEQEKTVKLVAIRIAVAKQHMDSAAQFFADWKAWTSSLSDFNITPMFLWIVDGRRGQVEVERKLIESRNRRIPSIPAHATHWVTIDQVDKALARILAQILPRGDDGSGG